jgi:hypothetical protein
VPERKKQVEKPYEKTGSVFKARISGPCSRHTYSWIAHHRFCPASWEPGLMAILQDLPSIIF